MPRERVARTRWLARAVTANDEDNDGAGDDETNNMLDMSGLRDARPVPTSMASFVAAASVALPTAKYDTSMLADDDGGERNNDDDNDDGERRAGVARHHVPDLVDFAVSRDRQLPSSKNVGATTTGTAAAAVTQQRAAPNMSKKEKRKQKHEEFLAKLNFAASAERQHRSSKAQRRLAARQMQLDALSEVQQQRQQEAEQRPVPSLLELADSLPSLNDVSVRKAKSTLSLRQRAQLEKAETQQFRDVQRHAAFKANPLEALAEHLGNRLRQANEEREAAARELARVQRRDQKSSTRLARVIKQSASST